MCALVPLVGTPTLPLVPDDLFVVVSVLLLGTVALALLGLESGTAFGGMGSSRHMTIAALVEPTVLVAVYALSIPVGTSALSAIVTARVAGSPPAWSPRSGLLAVVALGIAVLAETGRLPVDNPSTHLELTMVHEAMVLESSGRDLAWLEVGSWLRLTALLGLLVNLAVPWGVATTLSVPAILVGMVAIVVKLVAAGRAGRRRRGVPGQAAPVPGPRAAGRVVRAGVPGRDRLLPGRGRVMSEALFTQLLATTTGLLLVTAVLQVWRQSLAASIRLLAVQGAALAGLVAALGVSTRAAPRCLAVALLVLAMKAARHPVGAVPHRRGDRGGPGGGTPGQPDGRPARRDSADRPGLRGVPADRGRRAGPGRPAPSRRAGPGPDRVPRAADPTQRAVPADRLRDPGQRDRHHRVPDLRRRPPGRGARRDPRRAAGGADPARADQPDCTAPTAASTSTT